MRNAPQHIAQLVSALYCLAAHWDVRPARLTDYLFIIFMKSTNILSTLWKVLGPSQYVSVKSIAHLRAFFTLIEMVSHNIPLQLVLCTELHCAAFRSLFSANENSLCPPFVPIHGHCALAFRFYSNAHNHYLTLNRGKRVSTRLTDK